MNPGLHRHFVTLANRSSVTDDPTAALQLSPPTDWVAIQPYAPSGDVSSAVTHQVTMRYRPDVSQFTVITFGTRHLLVMGPPQNVDERNLELRLLCNEAV